MRAIVSAAFIGALGVVAASAVAQPAAAPPAAPAAPAKADKADKAAPAAKAKTEVTWYGHAAFRIKTPAGKTILVDPWIENPANPSGKADLATLASLNVDLILVTHGHDDHIGNAVELARKTKAKLVATYDLGKAIVAAGYPAAQAGMDTQGNFGGTVELLDGEVKIAFVPAVHSSQVNRDAKQPGIDGGAPGGFLISIKGGPAIYHTGDTDVFGDMALIREHGAVDVMLAAIGGHFTMDPARAAKAAKLVRPKTVVPMHFGTFPLLKGTPDELAKQLKKNGVSAKLKVMTVHETATF